MPDSTSITQGREMGAPDVDSRHIMTPRAFEVDTALLNTSPAEP